MSRAADKTNCNRPCHCLCRPGCGRSSTATWLRPAQRKNEWHLLPRLPQPERLQQLTFSIEPVARGWWLPPVPRRLGSHQPAKRPAPAQVLLQSRWPQCGGADRCPQIQWKMNSESTRTDAGSKRRSRTTRRTAPSGFCSPRTGRNWLNNTKKQSAKRKNCGPVSRARAVC
jgi:hypothetical protein